MFKYFSSDLNIIYYYRKFKLNNYNTNYTFNIGIFLTNKSKTPKT